MVTAECGCTKSHTSLLQLSNNFVMVASSQQLHDGTVRKRDAFSQNRELPSLF